ncbi:MAG: hypothetical protein PHH26_01545 [Candidatus Thermoplasmatota archaeon]|nr:hypothetical protein [Candidatus Thermoplasmatota archaeon]
MAISFDFFKEKEIIWKKSPKMRGAGTIVERSAAPIPLSIRRFFGESANVAFYIDISRKESYAVDCEAHLAVKIAWRDKTKDDHITDLEKAGIYYEDLLNAVRSQGGTIDWPMRYPIDSNLDIKIKSYLGSGKRRTGFAIVQG